MPVLHGVDEKVASICRNKKNVKQVQEYLIQLEETDDIEKLAEIIPILTGVFIFYIKQKLWKNVKISDTELDLCNDGLTDAQKKQIAEKKVNSWLHDAYKSFIKLLMNWIHHTRKQIQSFEALLNLIQAEYSVNFDMNSESSNNSNKPNQTKPNFPNGMFVKVIKELVLSENISDNFLLVIKSVLTKYDDLAFYTLKDIISLLENQNIINENISKQAAIPKNVIKLLMVLTNRSSDMENNIVLYINRDSKDINTVDIRKDYKTIFSSAWMSLMRLPGLPLIVQKQVLVNLDTKIIPRLVDPQLLIDFLSDCYDSGGVCSLLALNGLFVLINKYNLDYPDFYTKLYNILDVNVFNTKYKARFFYLLDMFLTSTHLPSYLTCAFIKKLSRMALFAPGEDMIMLLKFLRNLLIRHTSCRILIHREKGKDAKGMDDDPYDYEENDPYKCSASKSCLWELESLKCHYSKDVVKIVNSFKKEFPLVEDDITQYFDDTFKCLVSTHLDVEFSEDTIPPLNFDKTETIFNLDNEMWCM